MPARSTLILGDCLEEMQYIPDGSIDLILTDPPYGTTRCKWDSVIPLDAMWKHLKRIIKPGGVIVLFGSQPFTSILVASNINWFKYEWIWEKSNATGHLNAKVQPMKSHENVLVFYKKNRYFPQMRKGKPFKARTAKIKHGSAHYQGTLDIRGENTGTRYPRTNLEFPSVIKPFHSTQKPIPLLEYFIRTYTLPGDTVLDFTYGSGSTGEACVNTERNFIGIELDPVYYSYGVERVYNALIQRAQAI